MDSATIAVCVGAVGIAIGQWFTMRTVNSNAVNARTAAAATATAQADALEKAAKLQDERAERDRRWLKEDRAELARDLAGKVQATADTLAAKVAADAATLAQLQRDYAGQLAADARHDQQQLGTKVAVATDLATTAVGELKEQLAENTKISTDAFHEANGTKLLLVEEVKRRNDIEQRIHPTKD